MGRRWRKLCILTIISMDMAAAGHAVDAGLGYLKLGVGGLFSLKLHRGEGSELCAAGLGLQLGEGFSVGQRLDPHATPVHPGRASSSPRPGLPPPRPAGAPAWSPLRPGWGRSKSRRCFCWIRWASVMAPTFFLSLLYRKNLPAQVFCMNCLLLVKIYNT